MKSLHYDQCFFHHLHTYTYALICVVSSRRNKTNPQHGNKYIPVIIATHVQAFKPKRSTHDPSWRTDQQMLVYRCVCVSWNIFNRIHFFAIRDAFFQWCARFSCNINMIISNVAEAASTDIFSDHTSRYHIATWLHQYSSTSQAIASSQHHPRETRPSFGRPSLYRKSSTGLAY